MPGVFRIFACRVWESLTASTVPVDKNRPVDRSFRIQGWVAFHQEFRLAARETIYQSGRFWLKGVASGKAEERLPQGRGHGGRIDSSFKRDIKSAAEADRVSATTVSSRNDDQVW
jgi:hypothetical protein